MKNITFFQATDLSDKEIKDQFVARKKELHLLLSEIYDDDMTGSIQHYILIGQRGSGKSTLLRRIQAEINTETKLSERLIAVSLSEEQAGIYRLHDLWERVCDELRNKGLTVDDVDWESYDGNLSEFARALYAALQKALQAVGKKLVLLLDNIDRILENIKGEDNHLFRELLMNHKDVRIIGGSTRLSEHHWKYDQPFYQFFQMIRLQPLTEAEAKELLSFWANFMDEPELKELAKNGSGKLNVVRILSDGMPRTMLHLVELLINRSEDGGYEYLSSIIDTATPIYQERLGTLSPLQQKIVLELSFFQDAIKVKKLASVSRMESKTVSAVLKQLVDLQIVEKRKGQDKNMLYLIKERFFNLWLVMTQGDPKQKSRIKWLTIFLESLYNPKELKTAFDSFHSGLQSGTLASGDAITMASALANSSSLRVTKRYTIIDQVNMVCEKGVEYKAVPSQKTKRTYEKVNVLIAKEKWGKALKLLEDIEDETVAKLELLAFCYRKNGNAKLAEREYLKAIEIGAISAMNDLATLYRDTNRFEESEGLYLRAIKNEQPDSVYNILLLYYGSNKNIEGVRNRLVELDYLPTKIVTLETKLFLIIAAIWSGRPEQIEHAGPLVKELIESEDVALLTQFIGHLLVHFQENTVLGYFNDGQMGASLRVRLDPVFFVVSKLINNKESKAVLLTMPPEYEESVEEMIDYIKEKRAFYHGSSK